MFICYNHVNLLSLIRNNSDSPKDKELYGVEQTIEVRSMIDQSKVDIIINRPSTKGIYL